MWDVHGPWRLGMHPQLLPVRCSDSRATSMAARLMSDSDVLTVIVEFDIEPEEEAPLRAGIGELLPSVVSGQRGLLAASLHVSRDRHRVLIFLRWESEVAFERFRDDEEVQRKVGHIVGPYGASTRIYDLGFFAAGTDLSPAGGRHHP
jgi:heme-degrading monooxygenase HmoA